MKSNQKVMKIMTSKSKHDFSGLSFISLALCTICCLTPLIAIVSGAGLVAALSGNIEATAMLSALTGIVAFALYSQRKRTPACTIDCPCRKGERENRGQGIGC
jgi:hypothetical protein